MSVHIVDASDIHVPDQLEYTKIFVSDDRMAHLEYAPLGSINLVVDRQGEFYVSWFSKLKDRRVLRGMQLFKVLRLEPVTATLTIKEDA